MSEPAVPPGAMTLEWPTLPEAAAVALALAYLVLAIRQNIWCWPAALVSSLLYVAVMLDADLYMESALQVFYVGMALYGWWRWTVGARHARDRGPDMPVGARHARDRGPDMPVGARHARDRGPGRGHPPLLQVTTWPWRAHAAAIAGTLALSAASGWLLSRYTGAAWPYLDSFTTWGAVLATWMVARKLLENWLYWFVVDSVALMLCLARELYLTAGLFGLYLVLIVVGFRRWRADLQPEPV